jgi:hypothetical protein
MNNYIKQIVEYFSPSKRKMSEIDEHDSCNIGSPAIRKRLSRNKKTRVIEPLSSSEDEQEDAASEDEQYEDSNAEDEDDSDEEENCGDGEAEEDDDSVHNEEEDAPLALFSRDEAANYFLQELHAKGIPFPSFCSNVIKKVMEGSTSPRGVQVSRRCVIADVDDPVGIVDLESDADVMPTVAWMSDVFPPGLNGQDWNVMKTARPKRDRPMERKAFTAFMSSLAYHPFFEKYALTRSLTRPEKTSKKNAIASVVPAIYEVLWHFRTKFHVVRQKKQSEVGQTDVQVPSTEDAKGLISEIKEALESAIRGLGSSRRNSAKEAQAKLNGDVKEVNALTCCCILFIFMPFYVHLSHCILSCLIPFYVHMTLYFILIYPILCIFQLILFYSVSCHFMYISCN